MLSALLVSLLSPASACGGFFCNQSDPVDQAGETIVFEVDENTAKVTMHVQVDYEGPSESFAWVVPVSGVPDLFRSHDALFSSLHNGTVPFFWNNIDNSACEDGYYYDYASSSLNGGYSSGVDSGAADTAGGGGVQVLDTNQVASYETVTLSATNSSALVSWLQLNEYDVPNEMEQVLAPYVAGGMNFVAIKLAKDADTGNLAPLGMRYDGSKPAIPLTLTSIAASDNMPMTVYLLGEARGVPLNYLHVGLNPLAIDYWSGGNNLDDVINRAADEAGGQAFATEFAGDVPSQTRLYAEGMYDLSVLEGLGAAAFVSRLPDAGFFGSNEVLEVLRQFVPMPASFPYDEQAFYNDPQYFAEYYAQIDFDGPAAINALFEAEVEPRMAAQAMLERSSWLTRLRSSVSPSEMTLDPNFGFNPDLPTADSLAMLSITRLCDTVITGWRDAPQQLSYAYGQTLVIPSENALSAAGTTPFEYVTGASPFAALFIEQMATSGQPERITDQTDQTLPGLTSTPGGTATDPLLSESGAADEKGGCGCSSVSGAAMAWLPLMAFALGRRR